MAKPPTPAKWPLPLPLLRQRLAHRCVPTRQPRAVRTTEATEPSVGVAVHPFTQHWLCTTPGHEFTLCLSCLRRVSAN